MKLDSVSLIMHKGQGPWHSDLKLLQENVGGGLHRHRGGLAEDNFGSTENKTTRKWNQTSCLSPDEWIKKKKHGAHTQRNIT